MKYVEFEGRVPPVSSATRAQVIDALRLIVEVEGPVLGDRLHSAYVRASGGQRVGKQIASTLNSAIEAAVRRGVLTSDNPLGQVGVKARTYRLPKQPKVRVRERGPRALDQVPPTELAAIIATVADDAGWDHHEDIVRGAAQLLGIGRLTAQARQLLERVVSLAREPMR